jgi:hypothetical protein
MAGLLNLNPEILASILNQLILFKEDIQKEKDKLHAKVNSIPHWEDEQFRTFQETMRTINGELEKQIDAIQNEIVRVDQYIRDTKKAKDNF